MQSVSHVTINSFLDDLDKNPFYCPGLSAAEFLKSIRYRTKVSRTSSYFTQELQELSQSFSNMLVKSCRKGRLEHGGVNHEAIMNVDSGSNWLGDYVTSDLNWFSSPSPASNDPPPYSTITPIMKAPGVYKRHEKVKLPSFLSGRCMPKQKPSFSDFDAPPKYARSVQSFHDSSFEIDLYREGLIYSNCVNSSPLQTKEDLGTKTKEISSLILQLDRALPGIRLKERLENGNCTPQSIVDFLCENGTNDWNQFLPRCKNAQPGHINDRTLYIIRGFDVDRIVFAPSMFDEGGLNLHAADIYSIFRKPDNFLSLSELSFASVRLLDSDILNIIHLPSLSILNLEETGLGNDGVFLLVALKRTLTQLSLAANPDINNDAVPAIISLSNLNFLSILDTGIDMVGLRRLAEIIHEENRIMDVEIPSVCEEYVDNIHSRYLIRPLPPLTTNPYVCAQLSGDWLRRNLEAHSACNPSILATGTRQEMVQRLTEILKIRRVDLLVVNMLDGVELPQK